ncbi:hypothetical protein KSD_73280 [Ktedonobacter sp. SOSP1-85]|uniref:DUF3102 domain-containing protein n=1 Tax=Ktedonobacter sp. SOSP1-85 TaxID=2778367 RepID=UPI001915B977|nr:DUF3102 domain-containing protein [Ktedonobacter sp. SOSP1-85]GHO79557.1 hypothetical protein KSD_73280 [Ktedonobacter sp. SOSP1-85]
MTMQTPRQQDAQEADQQLAFDYSLLDEETRHFVYQKTVETQGYLKRTAEDVVHIGLNLRAVKDCLPHGHFMAWAKSELGLSRQSCQNFMRVAERFGERIHRFGAIPISALYELLDAPEDVLRQIEEQQIPLTRPAVRAAKEQARQGTVEEHHLTASSEQMPDDTALLQLRQRIMLLEQERLQLSQEVECHKQKEREEPVLPAQVQQHIQALEQQVRELSAQRETLSRHLASATSQARESVLERNTLSHVQQTRTRWREITTEFLRGGGLLLSSMPSALMLDTFEAEDWARLEQVEQILAQLLQAVDRTHHFSSHTVEAG